MMEGNNIFFRISELTGKYFVRNLTLSEQEELQEWLVESSERRVWFRAITKREFVCNKRQQLKSVDKSKGWSELKEKQRRRDRRRFLFRGVKYAAVVAIPILLTIFLLKSWEPESPLVVEENITPGKNKAILELADGQLFELQVAGNTQKELTEYVVVDSCKLDYVRQDSMETTDKLVYNKLTVPRGGVFQVVLVDGTKVWLNSESCLTYPVVFVGENREVYLDGEAYFEVASISDRPFIVHAGMQQVKVLGTDFGITHYANSEVLSTTLVEGRVEVRFPKVSDDVFILTPGYRISYDYRDGKIDKTAVDVEEYVAWKDGRYVFRQKRLETILETLSRWYDFEVFYQTPMIKERLFSGELMRFEKFKDILGLIEKVSGVKFHVTGRTVVVSGQ